MNYTDFYLRFPVKSVLYLNQYRIWSYDVKKDQKPNEDRFDEPIFIPLGIK